MYDNFYFITLIANALVLAAAFSSLVAFRFGAPLLLVFLGIGLAAGEDGLGIAFDNAPLAHVTGTLALAIILFDSGFGTPLTVLRRGAAPSLAMATAGVLITAGLIALPAHYLLGHSWTVSLLIGVIVAPTDAAAVFFLLNAGGIAIRARVRSVLEIESGSNDPIAIFLTLALVGLATASEAPGLGETLASVVGGFLMEMAIGVLAGLAGGWLITTTVEKLPLDQGLVPIFVLTLAMLVFSATGAAHGSGFLAVYVAGIIAGNSGMRSSAFIGRFKNGLSWLAQIVMFLVLGLFATPSQFTGVLAPAIMLALFLMIVARPLAAALCLAPFGFDRREIAFAGWIGLRGAVSILLALTPIIAGMESARAIFNMVFIVVLASLVVQGWSIGPVARALGLTVPPRGGPLEKVELELPGSAHHELLTYRVAPESPVAKGATVPRWARPSLVVRGGRTMNWREAGQLAGGDLVYLFVPDTYPKLLDRLFTGRRPIDPDDEDFFGSFAIDPAQKVSALAQAYDLAFDPVEMDKAIGVLMVERLGGVAEYADRVPLGAVALIVRDTGEAGEITAAGLSIEPRRERPPTARGLVERLLAAALRKVSRGRT
jgi:cell volume regulation protein A